jgi:hypothetical protein
MIGAVTEHVVQFKSGKIGRKAMVQTILTCTVGI